MAVLLARRDLLVLAASTRNFLEQTKGIKVAKSITMLTSEVFISAGPPFFRDTKKSINVYQCLSRVLHATDLRVFRDVSDYFSTISGSTTDFFDRMEAFRREGGDSSRYEEPLIGMTTEKEGLTTVRLPYAITAVCHVLGNLSDALAEKQVYLQRDYR